MCLGNHTNNFHTLDRITNNPLKDLFDLIDLQQSPLNNNCTYTTPEELKFDSISFNGSQLCVLHLNIHSLPSKIDELKSLLSILQDRKVQVDVILLCETFVTDNSKESCKIDGYDLIEEHRKNMQRGGVAAYVHKSLKYFERDDLNIFEEGFFESCLIEVSFKSKNIVIGEIYRVPGTSENNFISKYEGLVEKIRKEKKDIIIGTDQNLDFLKIHQHSNTSKFLDINLTNDLLPTISKPTRITHRSCTLIDNIYISNSMGNNMESRLLSTDISDHLPCLTAIKIGKVRESRKPSQISRRKINTANIARIKNALKVVNWNTVHDLDSNEGYDFLINKIVSILDTIAPESTVTIRPEKVIHEPWMSKGLVESAKQCDKKFKKVCGLPKDDDRFTAYKNYRNFFNSLKRRAKHSFYTSKITAFKNNAKQLWKLLKEITGKANDKSTFCNSFTIDGVLTSDNNTIANGFCQFYKNIGKKFASKIGKPNKQFSEYMPDPCDSSIYLFPTTEQETKKIIRSLKSKSSSGYDGISNILLKAIAPEITSPLTAIFNKSFKEGKFPDKMKIAEVLPLYKSKGQKDIMNNYRPVSLLPVISKVLEKLVHRRVNSFLRNKLLLFDSQFGFRTNHSTIDAVLEFIGKVIKGFDKGEKTLAVFLDLSKAFDTLPHEILLQKLENFGVRGRALDWFKSYLADRKMYVKLNGTRSNIVPSGEYGVPQGSVLGPLCFIMATNDLAITLKKCKSILFADDTTVYVTHKNLRHLKESIKHDLEIMVDWFKANKLTLNLDKTSFVLFQPPGKKDVEEDVQLSVGNVQISRERVVKFLGLFLDENLHFDRHVKHVCGKLSKNIYMLRNVMHLIPKWALRTLYFSYIQNNFTYGISIWGPLISKSNLKRIRTLQKKALRTIDHAKYNACTVGLCKKMKILLIDDIIDMELSKISYKYVRNSLPKPVKNLFQANDYHHGYMTRHRQNPRIQKHSGSTFNKSFLCRAPSIWSSLRPNLRNKNSIACFSKAYKTFKLQGY